MSLYQIIEERVRGYISSLVAGCRLTAEALKKAAPERAAKEAGELVYKVKRALKEGRIINNEKLKELVDWAVENGYGPEDFEISHIIDRCCLEPYFAVIVRLRNGREISWAVGNESIKYPDLPKAELEKLEAEIEAARGLLELARALQS